MPIFEEKRASPRRIVNCPGSIVSEAIAGARDCLIADIADGGVRISTTAEVPDEFVLLPKDGSGASHKCRVVWRLDDEIGAEFV